MRSAQVHASPDAHAMGDGWTRPMDGMLAKGRVRRRGKCLDDGVTPGGREDG